MVSRTYGGSRGCGDELKHPSGKGGYETPGKLTKKMTAKVKRKKAKVDWVEPPETLETVVMGKKASWNG